MSLDRALNANSVAIVGASKNETKRGFQAIKSLLNEHYDGRIYPVNPKEKSILGLKCYKSVSEIPNQVDMVLITTPAETIPAILEDCGKKNVAGAVLVAGGFGELDVEGRALEDTVVKIARKHDIRLIGPNTSGMINVKKNMNLVGLNNVAKGNIALLSQSGNMALTLITEASIKSQKGFSYYIGVGNEAEISFHEYLEFFENDPETKAILMYVEGMRNGRKFLQQAYKTSLIKPIIMLKSGRSDTGAKTAGSHTGALAGIPKVAIEAFQRAGVIVVEDSDKLFPAAEALSSLPPVLNQKIAILADGGGHATIASDVLTTLGVTIPELNKKTQSRLREILPAAASVGNPIDLAGGADDNPLIFSECAKILLQDNNIGGLLIVGLFGGYSIRFAESLAFPEEDAAHHIGKLIKEYNKPIVLHSLYNFAKPHSLDLLRYYNVPVYDSLEVACKCIGVLTEHGNYLNSYKAKSRFILDSGAKANPEGQKIIDHARSEGRNVLLEHEAKHLLSMYGSEGCPDRLANTKKEAIKIADNIAGPVVMKIVSPQILHKSEAGGVKLNIKTKKEVESAFDEIIANAIKFNPNAEIKGILVSPMVTKDGLEIIIGTKVDDQFGPIIMFGIGGIMVEVLKDVSFRVLPILPRSAIMMMQEIKSVSLLNGFRGTPAVDKKAIQKLLLAVSDLVESYPDILEMDLNPVIVHEGGINVVDARIILKSESCKLWENCS